MSYANLPPRVHPDTDVLVFLKRFGRGGVERVALRLARGLADAGLSVDRQVSPTGRDVPEWRELTQLIVATLRMVRARPPKLLFCPGNAYTIVAVMLRLLLGRRCPSIVAKISNDLERRDMPPFVRAAYRLWLRVQGRTISRFAVLSPAMADQVARYMRVPPHRIHVVPNPVLSRSDILSDAARSPGRPGVGRRFVAVGRLEPQKRFGLMLRAFASASTPADTLTIYGEGSEEPALRQIAIRLGVAERVRFAGYSAQVRDDIAGHDIFLLSSAYEGVPGVIVEALSVGLPIVATRCCPDLASLLDDGALGALVGRDDEAGFAHAIAAARPGTQDRARARAKASEFTLEAAVPAYLALFSQTLTGEPRRSRRPAPRAPRVTARA